MEDIRTQQNEVLSMASEYIEKLIPAITEICPELSGEMKDDTVDYLMQIIDGFNFMIECFNATREIVNPDGTVIIEDALEKEVGSLGDAIRAKDYPTVAKILEGTVTEFLKVFGQAAKEATK